MARDQQLDDTTATEPELVMAVEPSTNQLDGTALGAALGAYNVAPLATPISEAHVPQPDVETANRSLRLIETAQHHLELAHPTDEETDMSANPLYYVDRATDAELAPHETSAPVAAPVALTPVLASPASHAVGLGDNEIDDALGRLRATKDSLSATLDRCAVAADHLAASAEIFTEAAVELQRVALERVAMEQSVARAIDEIERVRDAIEQEQVQAEAQRAAMLAETTAATEAMRAEAVADVERARERLLRFTNEITDVASELQGAFATPVHKSA